MIVQVEVTQELIAGGEKTSACFCPIATAIKLALPGVEVAVSKEVWLYRAGYWWESVTLPFSAQDFISRFDNGGPVKPFSFPLPVPEWVVAYA